MWYLLLDFLLLSIGIGIGIVLMLLLHTIKEIDEKINELERRQEE